MEITIWGVLTGAILPLFGYLAFHYLASSREKSSRLAKACQDFRVAVIEATSKIPKSNKHWDNDVLNEIPDAIRKIETAVAIFKYFLRGCKSKDLENEFTSLRALAEKDIPQALTTENVMYGGGQHTPEQARSLFWEKIEELKRYAKKT
ncbi:hypothetical protein [Alcanivorax sp. DP30]|uniref:hypothetical protein n=1 Tax=Alcanivorax sp. DP30 TaxID=2606217 RepID=UPI001368FB1B|nr:hypothetical protein [Alcanivorax sp. DP30]MZR61535.1 hypothetical protein [Alcanivorax sp. DP30]